jgi:hypothetical protein
MDGGKKFFLYITLSCGEKIFYFLATYYLNNRNFMTFYVHFGVLHIFLAGYSEPRWTDSTCSRVDSLRRGDFETIQSLNEIFFCLV